MKYKGLYNFCRLYLSNDFLVKTRKVTVLQKFSWIKKCFILVIISLGFAFTSFSNSVLPIATITNSALPIPLLGSGHVNITVGTASTTGGAWAGTGSISDPRIFTPNATSTANISATELATALNTYAYVQITTATSAAGTNSGTVIFSSPISSTSALSGTDRKLTVLANGSITVASNITLTTSNTSGNENFKSADIEFTSNTGSITVTSTISTKPADSYLTNLVNYIAAGNISLTAASTILITATGTLSAIGGKNLADINTQIPGRGGNITLNGPGGITILGNIDNSTQGNAIGTFINGVAGTLTVNTDNQTSTTGGINDGQSTTAQFKIGAFTKEGAGNFVVKNFIWGGYPDLGTNYNNPNYTINNGKVTLAGSNAFDEKAQIIINNSATLDLATYSVRVGSLAGSANAILTGGTGSLLTLQYPTRDATYLKTTFNGKITGSISLYKTFPPIFRKSVIQHGALVLTNNTNDYTGTTTIDRGSIIITSNNALGNTSGKTTIGYGIATFDNVLEGGSLQVMNGITVAEPINVKGIGDNNYMNGNSDILNPGYIGAIYDSLGNNTFTGAITLDSAATISTLITTTSSPSNTLTLTTLYLSGNELTINNNKAAVNVSGGVISGTGGMLTKLGTDTLTLYTANTYTGRTKISAGTLKLGASNLINDASDIYFDGGNFSTASFSETVGNAYVTNSGSNLILGTGTPTISFAGSDNSFVSNTLLIKNWAGTYASPGSIGTAGRVKFTNQQSSAQVDRFKFYNNATSATHKAIQINSSTPFELVAGDIPSVTGFSNLNISSSATTRGAWTGDGSTGTPYTFTISAENANVNINEVLTKIAASNGNVILNANYAAGTQNGAIFFSSTGTATTTASSVNALQVNAKNSIVVNQPFSLSTDGTSTTAVVPSISLTADSIYINAAVKLNAAANSFSGGTAASGGTLSLTANSIVSIASTGSIESKGANNTATGATSIGGNGGQVSITGPNGISILGNINTSNGYSSASASTLNLSRPGKLTVSTNNSTISSSGSNDGQTTNTLTIGDLDKNGTGSFKITSSVWGGSASGTTSSTTPIITVNTGSLKLGSSTSMSDVANVVVASGASFDLNGYNETISTISGAGTISSTLNTNTLTLLSSNTAVSYTHLTLPTKRIV